METNVLVINYLISLFEISTSPEQFQFFKLFIASITSRFIRGAKESEFLLEGKLI